MCQRMRLKSGLPLACQMTSGPVTSIASVRAPGQAWNRPSLTTAFLTGGFLGAERDVVANKLPAMGLTEFTLGADFSDTLHIGGTSAPPNSERPREALLKRIDANLTGVRQTRQQLMAVEAPIDTAERAMRDTVIRWLEPALGGSLGDRTAISLLVGWSMQRRAQPVPLPG